jgi:signal transduction histidine kinase
VLKKIQYITIFIFLLCSSKTISQVGEHEIKAIYLIKIIDNFHWETSSEPFQITVVSKNNLFYKTLQKYSRTLTINGRSIDIKYTMRLSKKLNSDVIYYGDDKNNDLPEPKTFKNNVLIFTNNLKEMKHSMINFHLSFDQKLKFKVNKQQLINSGFNPSTIMLILGGSNTDILALLEEKDVSLAQEKNKSLELKKEIETKTKTLQKLQREYSSIVSDLSDQKQILNFKNEEIDIINTSLSKQKSNYNEISNRVKKVKKSYNIDTQKLRIQKEKSFKLEEQFQLTNKSFNEQKLKINEQEVILRNQNNLIKGAEKNLKYAFLFSAILLLISVFALISFFGKRKSNNSLAIKNKKIKEALAQLQVTQAKLIQSEKMASLGMVTAGMAHEINNPMTFIFTGASILKKELNNADPEIIETIEDIIMGAERVSEIIESLQNFSRLDENNVKKINLHENIKSTLVILGSHARIKNTTIKTHFDNNVKDIECFPASINQVIANIVANAIDAIKENTGQIDISTQNEKNFCKISIKDNGRGISEGDIKKIFDPFFTTKEVGKGTGLGLSISYNIIKKHNGSINVISGIGKGSTFIIDLPSKFTA